MLQNTIMEHSVKKNAIMERNENNRTMNESGLQ
jgi:hypothetical protein